MSIERDSWQRIARQIRKLEQQPRSMDRRPWPGTLPQAIDHKFGKANGAITGRSGNVLGSGSAVVFFASTGSSMVTSGSSVSVLNMGGEIPADSYFLMHREPQSGKWVTEARDIGLPYWTGRETTTQSYSSADHLLPFPEVSQKGGIWTYDGGSNKTLAVARIGYVDFEIHWMWEQVGTGTIVVWMEEQPGGSGSWNVMADGGKWFGEPGISGGTSATLYVPRHLVPSVGTKYRVKLSALTATADLYGDNTTTHTSGPSWTATMVYEGT